MSADIFVQAFLEFSKRISALELMHMREFAKVAIKPRPWRWNGMDPDAIPKGSDTIPHSVTRKTETSDDPDDEGMIGDGDVVSPANKRKRTSCAMQRVCGIWGVAMRFEGRGHAQNAAARSGGVTRANRLKDVL